ncbi:hypothetical protein JXI42_01105 [bacterium]|nr:hypothetical protein [bacterium]
MRIQFNVFLFVVIFFTLLSAQGNYEIMLNRPDINGLTGGGTTNLDGIPTRGLTIGTIMLIYDGSETRIYRLSAGTDAENSPEVVRPDDFASPGNEKVWKVSLSSDPEEAGYVAGTDDFQRLRAEDNPWLRDSVTFVPGANVVLTQLGDTIRITAAAGAFDDDWTRNDNYVHAANTTDSVGIGVTSPGTKLHVEGKLKGNAETPGDAVAYFVNTETSHANNIAAVMGINMGDSTTGYGGYFKGGSRGVMGEVIHRGTMDYYGLYGYAQRELILTPAGTNYGVYGAAINGGTNYGLYGEAFGGDSSDWAGYFSMGNVYVDEDLGVGVKYPKHKIHVEDYQNGDCETSEDAIAYFKNTSTSGTNNAAAVMGINMGDSTTGYGGYFKGGSHGVMGEVIHRGTTNHYGVYGYSQRELILTPAGNNYGVYGTAINGSKNYGLYGEAFGGDSSDWAGYFSMGNVYIDEDLGVGVEYPKHKLHVEDYQNGDCENFGDAIAYFKNTSTSGTNNTAAVLGVNMGDSTTGHGGYFKGGYRGVTGEVVHRDTMDHYGVYGFAQRELILLSDGTNYGVYGIAINGATNYGIYGEAFGGITNWAGYFSGDVKIDGDLTVTGEGIDDNDWAFASGSGLTGEIYHTGNVGIGNSDPTYNLDVTGVVRIDGRMNLASTGGSGILASSTNSSGIIGSTTSDGATDAGVKGLGYGEAPAIYGAALDDGKAGYFSGDVKITGELEVGGELLGGTGWVVDETNHFVYNTTDKIGIGTDTPSTQLEVDGIITASGGILSNSLKDHGGKVVINLKSISAAEGIFHVNTRSVTDGFVVSIDSVAKFVVDAGGGVSIGANSNPPSNGLYVKGAMGIGTLSPGGKLEINEVGVNPILLASKSDFVKFAVHNNGGVGIGDPTTPPEDGLYVLGNSKLDGHVGIGVEPSSYSKLHVKGTGSGEYCPAMYVQNSNSTGRVMHLYSNSSDIQLFMQQAGSGPFISCYGSGGTKFAVANDGAVTSKGRLTCKELKLTAGSDLSEGFDIFQSSSEDGVVKPEPGMVVSIDPDNPGKLKVCRQPNDRMVAGVISGAGEVSTGMFMAHNGTIADGEYPVALTGRVYVKADAAYGSISPGDLITTSLTPGYAMKVQDYEQAQGAILGKAMTALDDGKGLVLVLVSLQ